MLLDQFGSRTGRRPIVDDVTGRNRIQQHTEAGSRMGQMGDAALRIVVLAIEPLREVPFGGSDIDC